MGWWEMLFGAPSPWQPRLMLARGAGYVFPVRGEIRFQDNLDRVAGGKTEEGHNDELLAQLVLVDDESADPHAVQVRIRGLPVGFLPWEETERVRRELARLNPAGLPVYCRAKIVGGWHRGRSDWGYYGVKLSLSKKLRVAS